MNIRLFVGDVKGKTVILPDDMCSTAGTLVTAANLCAQHGAKQIIAVVAHGLFTGNALEKIEKSPIDRVIVTNSIPLAEKICLHPKFSIVSVAPLFAEALLDKENLLTKDFHFQ